MIPSLACYALASVPLLEMSRHDWLFDVSLEHARRFDRELNGKYWNYDFNNTEYDRICVRACRIAWTHMHAQCIRQILSDAGTSRDIEKRILIALMAHVLEQPYPVYMQNMVFAVMFGAGITKKHAEHLIRTGAIYVTPKRQGGWYNVINVHDAKNARALMECFADKHLSEILAFWDRLRMFQPFPYTIPGKTSACRTYRGAPAMWRVWLYENQGKFGDLGIFEDLAKINLESEILDRAGLSADISDGDYDKLVYVHTVLRGTRCRYERAVAL